MRPVQSPRFDKGVGVKVVRSPSRSVGEGVGQSARSAVRLLTCATAAFTDVAAAVLAGGRVMPLYELAAAICERQERDVGCLPCGDVGMGGGC